MLKEVAKETSEPHRQCPPVLVPVLVLMQRLYRSGEPLGNLCIETFNGKLRDGLLNAEALGRRSKLKF